MIVPKKQQNPSKKPKKAMLLFFNLSILNKVNTIEHNTKNIASGSA